MPMCISKYDDSQDPEDHLHTFNGAAHVEQWSLPVWCHMFAQTITGPARVWFDSLPSQSIDSFIQLKEKFLRNFGQQKKRFKNANEIMHIRRKENESVEQYMERFISESLLIEDVPEQMKVSSFINGVRHTQLQEKLGEDYPKGFDVLMDRVRAFIRGKDTSDRAREWDSRNS
ncbi:hypothetical protein L1987_12313 [Smallanthus sonchifolius]|uniref:Uncharacterized protein n=1 Tax=Smallanthus sonchifolius TaxID=185202 RepID=A0ACB9JDV9_9ASTR|nr:hypothetical protein L1987_12313 [Smallanthus sonchifolius]